MMNASTKRKYLSLSMYCMRAQLEQFFSDVSVRFEKNRENELQMKTLALTPVRDENKI